MDTLKTLRALNNALSPTQIAWVEEVLTGRYVLTLVIPAERSYMVVEALYRTQTKFKIYDLADYVGTPRLEAPVDSENILDQYLALRRDAPDQEADSLSYIELQDATDYTDDRAESPLDASNILEKQHLPYTQGNAGDLVNVWRCSEAIGCTRCGLCGNLSFDLNIAGFAGNSEFKSVLKITWKTVPLWLYGKIQETLNSKKIEWDSACVEGVCAFELSKLCRWCEIAYGM